MDIVRLIAILPSCEKNILREVFVVFSRYTLILGMYY